MWLIAASAPGEPVPVWVFAAIALVWAGMGFVLAFEPTPVEAGVALVIFAAFNLIVLIIAGGSPGAPDPPSGAATDIPGSILMSMASNGFERLLGEGGLGPTPIIGGIVGFVVGLYLKGRVESP
jgi:hypothetical protein